MYLSRLELDPRSRVVRKHLSDCHEMHRTILSGFPDIDVDGDRGARAHLGVLYRVELVRGSPLVYVQSKTEPDWDDLFPGFLQEASSRPGGNPAVREVGSVYRGFGQGRVLGFRLLANPTRKIRKEGSKNGQRVPLRTDEERTSWIERRAEAGGFEVLSTAIEPEVLDARALGQHPVHSSRGGRGKGKRLTFEGVLFEGKLRILDPGVFLETLSTGIGSGKAYGYGLLSVHSV